MNKLKSQSIWFCWDWAVRKGKRTKVPIAASGCATGVDDRYRCTWVTYDEAVKAAREHGYAGVGFVIPEGYFFLDIGHRDMGYPFVQMLLRRYNSYAENLSAVTAFISTANAIFHDCRPTSMRKESFSLPGSSI